MKLSSGKMSGRLSTTKDYVYRAQEVSQSLRILALLFLYVTEILAVDLPVILQELQQPHLAVQHHHQVPHHSANIYIIFKGTVSGDEYFGKNSFIQNGRFFYFIVSGDAGTDAAPPESIKLL